MARPLDPDEQELWRRVARTARRMHAARLRPAPAPVADIRAAPVPDPDAPAPAPARPLSRLRAPTPPRITMDLAPDPAQTLAEHPVQMDARKHQQMRRGRLEPESRIDLHGMTLAQAHPALTGFILWAQARGQRLVLVITGKGRGDGPQPVGALRREVPHWLRSGPTGAAVLEVREAHRRHGGGGALYVYLRRAPGSR